MKLTLGALACVGLVGLLSGCAAANKKDGECCDTKAAGMADAHGGKECKPADPAATPVAGVWNTACPIMGEDANGSGVTVAYNGKNVQFCCPGCVNKWDKMSDTQKATTLAKYEIK